MFAFYSIILSIGFILLLPRFLFDLVFKGKYAAGFFERLGKLPFSNSDAQTIWIHCVSVGELNAARPLISELQKQFPEKRIAISTTTKTGNNLAKEVFPDKQVFYFPLDWQFSVKRALDAVNPCLIVIMETEIWFNFLRVARKRKIPTVIANGRLSEKSFKGYSWIKPFVSKGLQNLDLALMQAEADAERMIKLGCAPEKVKITGNIKFEFTPLESDILLAKDFAERFGFNCEVPLIVGASTHEPEEEVLLNVFRRLKSLTKLRMFLVPRHPERFEKIASRLAESEFSFVRRSAEPSERDRTAEIILLDTIGELRAAFPNASVVFVGGSLIPHGGQSVLEPAAFGKAIVTGAFTHNFAAAMKEFAENDAVVQMDKIDPSIADDKLSEVIGKIITDQNLRKSLGENALAVMKKNQGALQNTVGAISPYLNRSSN